MIIFPTVHIGGTSQDALIDQLTDTISAIDAVQRTLRVAAPNERDYYPQGPAAFKQASRDHQARVECLEAVQAELQELAEHIADQ